MFYYLAHLPHTATFLPVTHLPCHCATPHCHPTRPLPYPLLHASPNTQRLVGGSPARSLPARPTTRLYRASYAFPTSSAHGPSQGSGGRRDVTGNDNVRATADVRARSLTWAPACHLPCRALGLPAFI